MPHKTDEPEFGRTLAAAGDADLTLTPKQVQAVKEAGTTMQTCLASLLDYLEEPLKSKFLAIKTEINQTLASLAPSDQAPAAMRSNDILGQLLGMLASAQDMITSLSAAAKAGRAEVATARASITPEIEKAIAAKITAGELVPKDKWGKDVEAATAAAQESARAEQKILGDRSRTLASLSLPPTPSDEVLAGKDEDFKAKSDRAKARAEKVKGFTLASATLSKLVWQSSDADFDETVALLTANAKPPTSGANPFAAAGPAALAAATSAAVTAQTELKKKVGLI